MSVPSTMHGLSESLTVSSLEADSSRQIQIPRFLPSLIAVAPNPCASSSQARSSCTSRKNSARLFLATLHNVLNACPGCSGRWAAPLTSEAVLDISTPTRRPKWNIQSTGSQWRRNANWMYWTSDLRRIDSSQAINTRLLTSPSGPGTAGLRKDGYTMQLNSCPWMSTSTFRDGQTKSIDGLPSSAAAWSIASMATPRRNFTSVMTQAISKHARKTSEQDPSPGI